MGSWKLGRVGLDVTADSVDAPSNWDISGDDIRFKGVLRASSVTDAKFLRTQMQGLVNNPDEPFVPFTWTEDPVLWDGFYRVTSASVSTVPMSLTAGWFPFEVSMTRLARASNAPLVESRLLGALRVNDHSIAVGTTVPWWATPADATQDLMYGSGGTSSATRTGSTGTVKVQYKTDGTVFLDACPTFQLAPGDWYDMSARIELSGDGGTTWRAVTGRQIMNLATSWRISNDLVRVTYGGGDGLLTVQHYSAAASAWQNAKTYKITAAGSTPTKIGGFQTLTILRNSPECVSIRLSAEMDSTTPWPTNVDLTLRRGSLWVDGLVSRSLSSLTSGGSLPVGIGLGIYRNTAEAATAHTGGVHATAADAGTGGGKYILNTSKTKTNDLTQGGFYLNGSGEDMPFQIGYEPASASGPDTFTNQTYSWFVAMTERQTLVVR